ncbi:MAG: guanylate kinase, partial [Acidobacteria bacterium]|nr:guanylate kinase [Acidobacteriota bacterium]
MLLKKRSEPLLVVISGPTGSGKTTIARKLVETSKKSLFSISHTTREKRPDEKDGIDYHFVSKDKFKQMIENKEFLEYARVHNNFYGTHKNEWEKAKKKGFDLILDIDVKGGNQVKRSFKDAVLIFVLPPSFKELLRRLNKRKGEKNFDIVIRFNTALKELDFAKKYQYNIINEEVESA